MGGILNELKIKPLIISGMSDHVHLLVSLPATLAPAAGIRVLKTNSSRWVHETFPERRAFAWQTGYAAFSVSESNKESVRHYIANQEAHHRKMSFKEELVVLLKKHGIEYDERYIWE